MTALDGLTLMALLLGLLLASALIFLLFTRRIRTVKQGHKAVVQSMDRFGRLVGPGPYLLWPWEEEIAEIWVAQRVVSGLVIPGIFTKGGLGVSVLLSYEMRLDLEQMSVDELYYNEHAREEQQVRILRRILLEAVAEAPPSPPTTNPNKVDVLALLHPLVGPAGKDVQAKLAQQAAGELAQRGFVITPGTLAMSGLKLPEAIGNALTELRRSDFTSAARHEFISRVRDAGGDMSDAALVQLLNAIQENPGNIHSIFTSGGIQPDIRMQEDNLSVRMAAVTKARSESQAGSDNRSSGATPSQPVATEPTRAVLPLTEEDMATLRSLVD